MTNKGSATRRLARRNKPNSAAFRYFNLRRGTRIATFLCHGANPKVDVVDRIARFFER